MVLLSQYLWVALGGALGAMLRYSASVYITPVFDNRFPLATFLVNALGSALMGVCYVLVIEKGVLDPVWRNILMTGFLGAFTTFSTFSLDAVNLWQNGHPVMAAAYIILSVLVCLVAASGAIALTLRWLA